MLRSLRSWQPSPRLETHIARLALVVAVIAGGIAINGQFGLSDAQDKLKAQQTKTSAIVKANSEAQALTCWRSMLVSPLIAERVYLRLGVFADPELASWYVGTIPTSCPPLPERLMPPARYRR
ncbi:MAG: hypothetical protein PGN13_16015 [Patulibacter minatonensis]